MKSHRTNSASRPRTSWQSLEQLADTWGLSRTRTNLVVKALMRSGRMEKRSAPQELSRTSEYRIV